MKNSDTKRLKMNRNMTGINIDTKRSNLGLVGNHYNLGKNWSMKRKTSVMRVTKPLRFGGIPWRES